MRKSKQRIQAAVFAKENGSWEYEDADFTRADWRADVANKDTQLGYFDWVIHNIESH